MARHHNYIEHVDQCIGNKIYSLRLAKGLSRQELAEKIGVTHQQLQKYEKGINRISVGRLVLIAKALAKSVEFFYSDIDNSDNESVSTQHQRMCIEVSRNFMKIQNPEHQQAVNSLIKSLVESEKSKVSAA